MQTEQERARERQSAVEMMYSETCTIFQFAQDKIVPLIDLSITLLEYVLGNENRVQHWALTTARHQHGNVHALPLSE